MEGFDHLLAFMLDCVGCDVKMGVKREEVFVVNVYAILIMERGGKDRSTLCLACGGAGKNTSE